MRVIISLLLIAVVMQSAFAVSSKANQAKIMIEKINKKLEKTNLGRALKNLVTLATKLGYNYDDLFDAFDTLKDSLSARKQDEEDLYSFQTSVHESNVQTLESDITTFTNDIVSHEAQLFEQKEILSQQEQVLSEHQASLAVDKQNRESAIANLEFLEVEYAKEVDQFAQARDLITQAIAHLQSAQEHLDNSQSFIQMQSKTAALAKKLAETTSKLSAKHQIFIQPVVMILSEVQESSIETTIAALVELQAYFQSSLSDLTNIYLNFKNYYETTISSLTDSINTYEYIVIPDDEQKIANSKVAIQQTEDNLVVDHANLDQATADLAAENEAFARTTERHNALIDRLNSEYDLVVSAEKIIRDAQANLEA